MAANSKNNQPFLCSWSGGKDSYLALHRTVQNGGKPTILLNVLNEGGERSRSHGIPKEVLLAQADTLNLPINFIASTWSDYEANYVRKLMSLKEQYEIQSAVFGDIDIHAHRNWEEKVSHAAGLNPMLPLWQEDRKALVKEMINIGIKALIVSCKSEFEDTILGKVIDHELIEVFEHLGIDVCGENGEYHTLVLDGPQHAKPLKVYLSGPEQHAKYSFLKMKLDQ